jgi:prolyl 4-hydroxylase
MEYNFEDHLIFQYNDFLSPEDCQSIIEIASKEFIKARVIGGAEGYRIAENTWLTEEHDVVKRLRDRVKDIVGSPTENMERINVVRYNTGGEYKPHNDFFYPTEEYYEKQTSSGGQRIKTVLFYLNDDFSGGETRFTQLGITIKPRRGKMIIWDNILPDGELYHEAMHAGLPVESGEKYIGVIWVREREYVNSGGHPTEDAQTDSQSESSSQ